MKKRVLNAKDLKILLKKYETKYGMDSHEFSVKFNRGELPEDTQYLKWITYYDMASKAGVIDEHARV